MYWVERQISASIGEGFELRQGFQALRRFLPALNAMRKGARIP
jgi:hypothetical protein